MKSAGEEISEGRDLSSLGNICALKDIGKTTDAVLKAEITRVSIFSTHFICYLSEAHLPSKISNLNFKCIFLRDAVNTIRQTNLMEKDEVVIVRPKKYRSSFPRKSNGDEEPLPMFIVGLPNSNSCEDIYYRRKTMENWVPLEKHGRVECRNPPYARSQLKEGENSSEVNGEEQLKNGRISCPDVVQLKRAERIPDYKSRRNTEVDYDRQETDIISSFISHAPSQMSGKSTLNSVPVKLAVLRTNMIANVLAIVTEIGEDQQVNETKFRMHITIMDESTKGFNVWIFYQNKGEKPIIRKYDIVWLPQLKVK